MNHSSAPVFSEQRARRPQLKDQGHVKAAIVWIARVTSGLTPYDLL
jgi:hypothetical protein